MIYDSISIRCIFSVNHNKKFVPTYIALKAETLLPNDERPYVPLQKERARKPTYVQKHPSSKKGKGKAKAKQATEGDGAVAYDAEREWFIAYLRELGHTFRAHAPANYAQPKDPKKCRLWDPRDQDLYRDEVAAARENAQREILENEKGNVQEDDVEVALPEVNIVPRRPPMPHFGPAEPGRPRMNDPRAGARANALLPVDGDRVGILEERFRAVARIPLPLAPNERNERMRGYLQEMEGRIARLHEARLPPVAAPVARLDAAPALRNRAVRGQIQPPVLNVPEMPPGVPRLDDVDFRLQRLIHELRARRDQGGDNQDDFVRDLL
ncbi:hypothetical protein QFC19_008473 [Naganishia cerealis]|uniref:Uncharacterized protein n=1 Tax=Naganishia cerealis TaxID=610337 RepID=A0ACC2V1C3_9TREE|nr:hypothetical protein QFC19_008473 [Naganishia cerealis]